MTSTLIALCLWAFVTAAASLRLPAAPAIACLAVGLLPFSLWSWRQISLDLRKRHALALAAGLVGITDARFAHFQASAGIVLDPAQRTLTLSLGKEAKRYRYADVREWRINAEAGELQLWMRDAQTPTWNIAMPIEQTRRDWSNYLKALIDQDQTAPSRISAIDYAMH